MAPIRGVVRLPRLGYEVPQAESELELGTWVDTGKELVEAVSG